MSKRRRNKNCDWHSGVYWQSADFNERVYSMHLSWIVSLAINRFKWVGLPESCNTRFLENTLLRNGYASLAMDDSDTWYTLLATFSGEQTMYGEPASWQAQGFNGAFRYDADWTRGAIIWENRSFMPPWNAIQLLARKLTHYYRTEDVNLSHQMTPWLFTAPREKKQELTNLLMRAMGGEPAIMASNEFADVFKYEAISTQTPYIGHDLYFGYENVWRQVFRYLGIDHLAVEKKERMTSEEVMQGNEPVIIKRMDALQARRDGLEIVNRVRERMGDAGDEWEVVFNNDLESYNWYFLNDAETLLQVAESGAPTAAPGEVG